MLAVPDVVRVASLLRAISVNLGQALVVSVQAAPDVSLFVLK